MLEDMMDDSQDLNYQYSPSQWTHRLTPHTIVDNHIQVCEEGSAIAKATIEHEEFSYGHGAKQKYDIFGGKTLPGDAPILVYIHGGYWQALGREISSFVVPPLAKAGAVVVVMGYDLAPEASMDEIVKQITCGISFVLTMALRRGSSGVYVCGHSAGAHLAAMALAQDWMAECMVNYGMIKGAILVSGIYDLSPLVHTYVNNPLKMTPEEAEQNSPAILVDKIIQFSKHRKMVVAFGEHDPPEFQRQSADLNTTFIKHGIKSTLMIIPNTDHFNVIEQLRDEDYILTQEVLRLLCLNIGSIVGEMANTNIS